MALSVRFMPVILLSAFASLPAGGQPPVAAKAWKPDKKLVERLAKEEVAEGYGIRPPKGYQILYPEIPANVKHMLKIQAWVGKPRKDTSKASLLLQVVFPAPGEPFNMTVEQAAEHLAKATKEYSTDWKQDQPEKGLINGLEFARIRWSGVQKRTNRAMKGFLYVALDGVKMVRLTSQDFVPEDEKSLPLAEASVFTLKRMK